MIEIFKITHETVSHHIPSYARANTRGNNYELVNHSFIMIYPSIFFSACIVNTWNSLPNSVVDGIY